MEGMKYLVDFLPGKCEISMQCEFLFQSLVLF